MIRYCQVSTHQMDTVLLINKSTMDTAVMSLGWSLGEGEECFKDATEDGSKAFMYERNLTFDSVWNLKICSRLLSCGLAERRKMRRQHGNEIDPRGCLNLDPKWILFKAISCFFDLLSTTLVLIRYWDLVFEYRDEIYFFQILLSRTQAGPGRTVEQEQGEISPNHVQRINLISVIS